jgi:hypothetical protein
MNACIYTNRGEEVPLGMECALPYLAHSTPSPNGGGIARTNPTLYLVKGDRHAATFERPDPVHS